MNLNSEAIRKNDVEIAINNVSVVFKDNQGNDVKPKTVEIPKHRRIMRWKKSRKRKRNLPTATTNLQSFPQRTLNNGNNGALRI